MDPDLSSCLDHLTRHFGEPYADASMIPSYYLYQGIRKQFTMALSGDGGDEIFCGYQRYRRFKHWQRARRIPGWIRAAPTAALRLAYHHLRAMRPELKGPLLAAEFLNDRWTGQPSRGIPTETSTTLDMLLTDEARSSWSPETLTPYMDNLNTLSRSEHTYRQLMLEDRHGWLPYDILPKVDICSMAHGLEIRSPLLDDTLIRFVDSLPIEYVVGTRPKNLLIDAFKNELHPDIQNAPKSGFGFPLRESFANRDRTYLSDTLSQPAPSFARWINTSSIQAIISEHTAGTPSHTTLLLKLLSLKLWLNHNHL